MALAGAKFMITWPTPLLFSKNTNSVIASLLNS
jgi:hypothetical protein